MSAEPRGSGEYLIKRIAARRPWTPEIRAPFAYHVHHRVLLESNVQTKQETLGSKSQVRPEFALRIRERSSKWTLRVKDSLKLLRHDSFGLLKFYFLVTIRDRVTCPVNEHLSIQYLKNTVFFFFC